MIITKEILNNNLKGNRIVDMTHKDGSTGHSIIVEACPEKGFNFGYLLYLPKDIREIAPIFVKCANTGRAKPNLEEALKDVLASSLDFEYSPDIAARNQRLPILKPFIPRFFTENESLYSHNLSSSVYFTKNELFKNLDIQMINMIKDAKERLEAFGIIVDEKIIIEGFSASGAFANRFTVLHPELVMLCISGGFNGQLLLPLKEYVGKKIIFPVGISNILYYNNDLLEEFKLVRQFYYMGSLDDNDSLATVEQIGVLYPKYKDVCTKEELDLFFSIFGRNPIDRFFKSKKLYYELGVNADFKIYDGYGHTEAPALEDIEEELKNMLRQKNIEL